MMGGMSKPTANASLSAPATADREERLAAIIAGLTDRLANGQTADVEQATRDNPDLADELAELWSAAALAHRIAKHADADLTLDRRSRESAPGAARVTPTLDRAGSFGDYDLISELGRGGMGVIYRAWHRPIGREVALKMILKGSAASDVDVSRFRAEAAAAGRLDHPNIIPIYEVGERDGQHYFTMKLIEGVTLADRLTDGPIAPR